MEEFQRAIFSIGLFILLEKIKHDVLCIHGNKRIIEPVYNVTDFCFLYLSIVIINSSYKIRPASTQVLFFASVLYLLFQKRPIEICVNRKNEMYTNVRKVRLFFETRRKK